MSELSVVTVPELWAAESLDVLRKNLVLFRLISPNFNLTAQNPGDVVNTRFRTKMTAKDGATVFKHESDASTLISSEIEVQRPTATNVAITLNKVKYVSFGETDYIKATSINSIRSDYIEPSLVPLAESVDDDIFTEYTTGTDYESASITSYDTVSATFDSSDVTYARKILNDNEAPTVDRFFVMGTTHEYNALSDTLFVQANTSGSTDALERAQLGNKLGFQMYMSQNIADSSDSVAKARSIAFQRGVMAIAVRPLPTIEAGLGAVMSTMNLPDANLSCRVTVGYNHRAKCTDISFDMLYGVKLLNAALGIIVKTQ